MTYIIITLGVVIIFLGLIHVFLVDPAQKAQLGSAGSVFQENIIEENPEGLLIEDAVVGEGEEVKSGDTVVVHYVGTLSDGTTFDSSRNRDQPFSFPLGQGVVIHGWERGIAGMKIGGIRRLVIPPALAYGARGFPPAIPPNATLTFEVELLEIR